MFSSRRMKTIKALKDGNKLYVKSSILKSFSSEVTRTATLLFVDNIPQKGFCECPVGKCGLCCHVIVIILQLEHLTNFNELFLSLTCTQKLQKCHRPTKGDKRNIRSASHIRLKYFRKARSARQVVTQRRQKKRVATTPEKVDSRIDKSDWLKRDVSQMSSKVSDGTSKCNVDVSSHFLQTLKKYEIKRSVLYCHLSYRSAYLSKIIHKEHDYAKQIPNYDENVLKPVFAAETGDIWHSILVPSNADASDQEINMDNSTSSVNCVCSRSFFCPEKTQTLLDLLAASQDEIITVKISDLQLK